MAKATAKAYGKIDVLVNNAAVSSIISVSRVSFVKVLLNEWNRVMLVNLEGTWLCCCAVVPHMKRKKGGRVVSI